MRTHPDLLGAATTRAALAPVLRDWLPTRRWFGGKARSIASVRVRDALVLSEELADYLVEVAYEDGGVERYQVPLVTVASPQDDDLAPHDAPPMRDALRDEVACRCLAGLTLAEEEHRSAGGAHLVGRPVGPSHELKPDVDVRVMTAEQSNSSIVLGGDRIFKLFRRLEPGINPDIEVTRGLTEAGFAHVPAQLGAAELVGPDGSYALGVTSVFLAGAQEGWDLAWRDAARTVGDLRHPGDAGGGAMAGTVGELGSVVARMHRALAELFGIDPAGPRETTGWAAAWRERAGQVLDTAARRAPDATAPVLDRRDDLLEALGAVAGIRDPGPLIRIHGDLHLGQTLRTVEGRWYVLDFEGEPARPLQERRATGAPARDVAGVLRSFGYAAAQGARAAGRPPAALQAWVADLRTMFLAGYRREAGGLLPGRLEEQTALLRAFELDKAVYELGYELANRPDWVAIPVSGILRLLEPQDGHHDWETP